MILHRKSKIETFLSKEEILEAISQVTIPYGVHSIFIKVRDYIFYKGKFENMSFSCTPLPTSLPLGGSANSFLPAVKGTIFVGEGKNNIVEITVSGTEIYVVFLIIFNLSSIFALCAGVDFWKYFFIMVGVDAALLLYFQFASGKTIGLFEKIIHDAESNKKD